MSWLTAQWESIRTFFLNDVWVTYGTLFIKKAGVIALIIGLTWLLLAVRRTMIVRIFHLTRLGTKQQATLTSLMMSLSRYTLFLMATLLVLTNIGIEIGPIIAGAGVLGLALGFGAQTMIKDFIAGFFILFEDQFSVGDYVTLNNNQISGTVQSIGLRSTHIRTWAQQLVVIQNSEIRVSQNFNRERMRAIIHVTVPYETNPAILEEAIETMSAQLLETMPHFFLTDAQGAWIEAPQLYGITDVENNALGAKYTVIALVKDEHYWHACKEIRKALVIQLASLDVHISYPRKIERQEQIPQPPKQ